ncbi:hypothetical protein CGI08_23320 [Vibrio parahaemolyticus]|uniref:hypothetical protein n=1 Tax=Vibrio parahaemolyticus TaxID=670 RepID=UPI00112052D1|nr:hypothetical protein [Vibrio parahaemolyticus]TOK86950.1 hypothetical protein CGI08_23320 [Vibrio parahaemolyticus]
MTIELKKPDKTIRRSRDYFIASFFSLLVISAAYYIASDYITTFQTIPSSTFWILFALAVCSIWVYWYLQIKPVTVSDYRTYVGFNSPKEALHKISEIYKAIEIYDEHSSQKNSRHELKYIEDYIKERLDIFPRNHEFHKYNILTIDLENSAKRSLFLASLKSRSEKLQKEAEEVLESGKTTERQESKDKASRTIELVSSFTNRLKQEIEVLSRRANIYIVLGSGITLFAGAILFFIVNDIANIISVRKSESANLVTNQDWFSLVSRFSIVVFVEIFAFYYLRLYRNMMDNIKFYQNEITNIEMKLMAAQTVQSLNVQNDQALNTLISSLSNTERNFVIDKGKTTVDIESRKLDNSITNSVFNNVHKLTKTIRQ